MRGYLGLGSNVGRRLEHLRAAAAALPAHGAAVVGSSRVYETEPQGEVLDQPDFLNAVVAVQTQLDPEGLLDACKAVERELGRDFQAVRHGPRVVDIDVLLLGDLEHRSERLTLPHRDILVRRFVLAPLVELGVKTLPDGTDLAEALASLEGQRVAPVAAL